MPTRVSRLRVALVHDWINGYRGGERILNALCELFPSAPIYTLFYEKGSVGHSIEKHPISASFLNQMPLVKKYYRYLLPVFPMAIERFHLTDFDLVISSSHCVAKGVIVSPQTLHVCYTHTPMRYVWDRYHDYFHGPTEPLIAPFASYLRTWDVASSARVDHFIANSNWVKRRILKYYRRDADVLFPFVDLKTFGPAPNKRNEYYLVVSAFAPYKRIDLAIEACKKMDRRLLIVGDGQNANELRRHAGAKIEFLGTQSPEKLRELYQNAIALLSPGEEDFGITPLESMACGTPVIAFGCGGAVDSVVPEKTGIFFFSQTTRALCDAIEQLESGVHTISLPNCRAQAEGFSLSRFKERLLQLVANYVEESQAPTHTTRREPPHKHRGFSEPPFSN